MALKDTTLDAMSDRLAEAFGAMTDDDRAKLQARLAERLGADVDVLAAAGTPEDPAASGRRLQRMAARQGKATPSPEQGSAGTSGRTVLTASSGLYGYGDGDVLSDRRTLALAMAETLKRLDRKGPARGKVLVASATTDYPSDRRLTEDQEGNAWLLDAVTSPMALVATGGVCLPVNVDYAVPTWATAERPLRDSLPAFQATRGGLRFVKPLDVGDWMAASTVWTEATDASPGVEVKPVVAMTCGSEELVYVNAIPTRIGFGNMQSRFAPEQVAANTDLAIAAAARTAENELLTLIAEACVKDVTQGTASQLGAVRELLSGVDQISAQQRQLHRLPDGLMLTAVFPRWLRNELRIDMAREQAHQNGTTFNSLAISDAEIDGLFTSRGVRPVWHYDGLSTGEGVSQVFAAPEAKKPVKAFPTKVVWYCWPEGAMQFLDAGRLDLGVIRDSTLSATNDYEVMTEVFEGIAQRGYANAALQVVSTIEATGTSSATLDMKGKPPTG